MLNDLHIIGINYRSAPLAVRECAAFSPEKIHEALQSLQTHGISESMVLSTCNRIEIIVVCSNPDLIVNWMQHMHPGMHNLDDRLSHFTGETALSHLIRVASGLDSMVLGESQILGQVKKSFEMSQEHNVIGDLLGRVIPQVFQAAKHIRHDTNIGEGVTSLGSYIQKLAEEHLPHITQRRPQILCVGAGMMMHGIISNITSLGHVTLCNRSLDNAKALAARYHLPIISLEETLNDLPPFDILITATSAEHTLITYEQITAYQSARDNESRLIVDLAVPRDVESSVNDIKGVHLYNIDQLTGELDFNQQKRQEAADQAEPLVQSNVELICNDLKVFRYADTIKAFRAYVDDLKQQELEKGLSAISAGRDPSAALEQTLNQFSQKLLHQPTSRLREAAINSEHSLIESIEALFELVDSSS